MRLLWSLRAGPDQAVRRESNPLCSTTYHSSEWYFFVSIGDSKGRGVRRGEGTPPYFCRFGTALFVCAQRGFGKVHRRETLCFVRDIQIRTGSGSDLILYAPYGNASIVFYEYWAFPRLFRGTFYSLALPCWGQGIAR